MSMGDAQYDRHESSTREHEELLCAYVNDRQVPEDRRRQREGQSVLAELPWDPISPDLAGCIRVKRLVKLGSRFRWGKVLELIQKSYKPPEPDASEPKTYVSVAKWIDNAKLAELEGVVLKKLNEDEAGRTKIRARCGLFGVEKAGKNCLRVIFDARPANEALPPRPEKLLLFTLPEVVDGFRRFRFVFTVDYRHYYYQFKLPSGLQEWFIVEVVTVDKEGKVIARTLYKTLVLPMGFREAVVVAQSASWVIVLHREEGQDPLGIDPEEVNTATMPVFVSLRKDGVEVGRIYVLLDGIAVLTDDAQLRDAWKKRLEQNEKLLNVQRKEDFTADLRSGSQEIDFGGILFSAAGWRPRRSPDAPSGSTSHGTPAEVASRLGKVLWAIRVRSALAPATHGLLAHSELMALYQLIGAAGTGGWNRQFKLSTKDYNILETEERALAAVKDEVTPWPQAGPRVLAKNEDAYWCLATDAFVRGLGYVWFSEASCAPESVLWAHKALEETKQIEAEAAAIPWAVRSLMERTGRRPARLIVAVDADSVRVAVNKRYARSPALRESLGELFELCADVLAVRVPGLFNAADLPSRGKPPDGNLLAETWALLRPHARSLE